jgi:Holliday junction resolvase
MNVHGSLYAVGIPDILGCLNGRFIAIEVKRPKATPRKIQKVTLRKIERAGGVTGYASTVQEVKVILSVAGLYDEQESSP